MVGILLMTHAPLSAAFLSAATHVYQRIPEGVRALDVVADQSPYEVNQMAAQDLLEIDTGDGVLILTDICGATPSNCAQKLVAMQQNLCLIYGLSVPMLLRALNYRDLPLLQVAQKVVEGGKNGVMMYEVESPTCSSGT